MNYRPLTFVTSVFGMTNMPADPTPWWPFGITLAAVCIPCFSLIGFLSTDFGYRIWAAKTKAFWRWIRPKPKPKSVVESDIDPNPVNRTLSTEEGMRLRMGQQGRDGHREKRREREREREMSHPNIKKMVEAMGEGRQSGLVRLGTMQAVPESKAESVKGEDERTSKDTVIDVKDA